MQPRMFITAGLITIVAVACGGGSSDTGSTDAVTAPTLGGSCPTLGATTGLRDGTAECVDENGSLIWMRQEVTPGSEAPQDDPCGSPTNPPNPAALPSDNANVRASLDAFPVECLRPSACAPEGDQAQYQWYRTDYNLSIDPRNTDRLLVAIERLGLFESLDRGASWRPLSESGILHALAGLGGSVCWTQTFDITFDPAVPGRIYLNHGGGGTIEAGIWQARGAGLYRSDDDGKTWSLLTTPDMNAYVAGFTIDPTSSDTLYMGTSASPLSNGGPPTVYVETGLVYRSDDAGRTWRELPTGWGAHAGGMNILVDPTNRDSLLLGVYRPPNVADDGAPTGTDLGPGWYTSTDGGATWADVGSGPGFDDPVAMRISVSPDGSGIVNSFDVLSISTDRGATWRRIEPMRWVPTFDPHADNRRIYAILSAEIAGTDRDQFTVSNDAGRTWKTLGELPPEIRINEWNEPPLNRRATPSNMVIDPVDPLRIYITGAGGTIARSDDGGRTWTLLTTWESFPASTARMR